MAAEIERKFLVAGNSWQASADGGTLMRQGYMGNSIRASIRVRIAGARAYLNIKSATLGIVRQEYEYEIPVADADQMLDTLCERPLIEKTRYLVPSAPHVWEIDVFHGDNAGLVVAEIELGHEDETFARTPWLGEEVSHDPRYYNVSLVRHPFKDWS